MATENQQHHDNNGDDDNALKEAPVIVIIVPFPLQSHMNQLFQLSLLISSYNNNIPLHYIGSSFHNSQVRARAHGFSPLDFANIHFHDFPIPLFVSNINASSNSSDLDLQPSFHATKHLCQPLSALLLQLSSSKPKRSITIIHDVLCSTLVQDAAYNCSSSANAESYDFSCVSAFDVFSNVWEAMGKPFELDAEIVPHDLPSLEKCITPESKRLMAEQYQFIGSKAGHLYNTSRLVEGIYVDFLARKEIMNFSNGNIWAIGPLHMVNYSKNTNSSGKDKCLEWLDKQAPNSVLYVSFGTTTSMDDKQIEELALGLEQSGTKFIWVLRDADEGNVPAKGSRKAQLPKGFEERVKEVGMVVRDWANQIEILGHESTGGFMSHCGWYSCMESISMGVPIVAWPIQADQPRNAVLITQILKVGVNIREWESREPLVMSSVIRKGVRKLMASDEGNEMRKKAQDLGCAVRKSTEQGGVSRKEWDSFITHISQDKST